jgi:hypothetical protein
MKFPFLPRSLRWIGYALFIPGLTLGILWGYAGFKPEWLKFPVFAVYSSYLKTVTFGMTHTNLTDELAAVLLLSGLLWLAFTKERTEDPGTGLLRYKALFISVLINSVFLLFSIVFIFGIGFIDAMIINLFSQLGIYLVALRVLVVLKNIRNA